MLNTDYTENLTGLKDVIVTNVENYDNIRHIHLKMEKRIHECPRCGMPVSKVHDYRTQSVKDIPSFGYPTVLHLRKRRHECPYCGKIFAESVPFLPKYQRTTNRLWAFILHEASYEKSMKQIARENALSNMTVSRIVDTVSFKLKTLPEILSIDEFRGNSGGEKFQCIITDPKRKRVLDILPERKAESLYEYFGSFSNREDVKLVVMDMSTLFRSVARASFPKAEIIADRYHVVRQVTWAFENVRKKAQKEFGSSRRKYFKRSRKLLLKHPECLDPDELEQVSHMLAISKDLAKAYYLKNEFYEFMKSSNIYEARKRLGEWFMKAGAADLTEFSECVTTYTNWEEEILNAFRYPYSNGYTEGCNNRIKVIKRISYGMQNFERFRKRILHIMSA